VLKRAASFARGASLGGAARSAIKARVPPPPRAGVAAHSALSGCPLTSPQRRPDLRGPPPGRRRPGGGRGQRFPPLIVHEAVAGATRLRAAPRGGTGYPTPRARPMKKSSGITRLRRTVSPRSPTPVAYPGWGYPATRSPHPPGFAAGGGSASPCRARPGGSSPDRVSIARPERDTYLSRCGEAKPPRAPRGVRALGARKTTAPGGETGGGLSVVVGLLLGYPREVQELPSEVAGLVRREV